MSRATDAAALDAATPDAATPDAAAADLPRVEDPAADPSDPAAAASPVAAGSTDSTDVADVADVADGGGTPPARRGGGRLGLGAAVAGCVLGAALVLGSAEATWVTTRISDGATALGAAASAPLPIRLGGSTLAPAVGALGLVGLAAAVALVATRRRGRTVVGVLLALTGLGIVLLAGRIALDPLAAVRGAAQVTALAPSGDVHVGTLHRTAGPWVASVGGLLVAITGVLVALRGGAWPGMGGRYQSRAERPVDAWDAIERGQDPTDRT
jgi:uncharacterized membrane protein (TIGR02234 family)